MHFAPTALDTQLVLSSIGIFLLTSFAGSAIGHGLFWSFRRHRSTIEDSFARDIIRDGARLCLASGISLFLFLILGSRGLAERLLP